MKGACGTKIASVKGSRQRLLLLLVKVGVGESKSLVNEDKVRGNGLF